MADLSQPNNLFSDPSDHLSHLLAPEMDEPWYKSFIQNIKDTINPPKLPPLVLTSKPVPVKDIWGLYGRQKKSFAMSTGGQVLFALLLFTVASSKAVQDKVKQYVPLRSEGHLVPLRAPEKVFRDVDGWPGSVRVTAFHCSFVQGRAGQGEAIRSPHLAHRSGAAAGSCPQAEGDGRRWRRRRSFSVAGKQRAPAQAGIAPVHTAHGCGQQSQSQAFYGAQHHRPTGREVAGLPDLLELRRSPGQDRSAFQRAGFGRRYRQRFRRRRGFGQGWRLRS